MAIRSVKAIFTNETDHVLIKLSDECPDGEWITRAPDRIEARSVATMMAESILLGDVESRATYSIEATGEQVYIHWSNPAVGSNSYHTNTGAGHYAFVSGPGSGSHPLALFYLRSAGRTQTDFLPSNDGFKFSNRWGDVPYSLPPLRGSLLDMKYGSAKNGLCGGMVLAALDYFTASQEIPQVSMAPAGEQDPLFVTLVDRLFDTFSVNSVTTLLKLMNPVYPDGDENIISTFGLANGRAAVMILQEWPLIRNEIDSGRPSPICIVTIKSLLPWDLGENHQLLAYAYDVTGHDVTIWLYDPNQPGVDTVYLKFNDGSWSERVVVEHNIFQGDSFKPVYCFVRMDGSPAPVSLMTRPRLTRFERRERRVRVTVQGIEGLSSRRAASGRAAFDVWPDCGKQDFDYTVDEVQSATVLVASMPFYRNPALSWMINGKPVPDGIDEPLMVQAEAAHPEHLPPRPEEGQPPKGFVRLVTSVVGSTLRIVNDPSDGNYSLVIQAQASEPGGEARTYSVINTDVLGQALSVFGLAEASAGCWKRYLQRHQAEQPDVASVVAMLYSQLRRPANPLWDPDPSALEIGILVSQDDPAIQQIGTWRTELPVAEATRRAGEEALNFGADLREIETVRLNPETLRVQFDHLRFNLGRFG